MDFCYALNAMKEGQSVERSGWNGKGMYIFLLKGDTVSCILFTKEAVIRDFIMMKTVQDDFVPWLASQSDLLAEDWQIVN